MKLLAFARLSTLALTAATASTTQPVELSEGRLLVQIDDAFRSVCTVKTESSEDQENDSEF